MSPSLVFYQRLQDAFDFFNAELFDRQLPHCLLTLRSSHRVYGYHHHQRFISLTGQTLDELGLHPGFFTTRSPEDALSTLVHEMVHHWQAHFGKITPSNPHNHEWAKKMQAIGLMPSDTGLPGGKTTGRQMTHYILPDGPYLNACRRLIDSGFEFTWMDRVVPVSPERLQERVQAIDDVGMGFVRSPTPVDTLMKDLPAQSPPPIVLPSPPRTQTRIRLMCSECQSKAWVAPDTALICGKCHVEMK